VKRAVPVPEKETVAEEPAAEEGSEEEAEKTSEESEEETEQKPEENAPEVETLDRVPRQPLRSFFKIRIYRGSFAGKFLGQLRSGKFHPAKDLGAWIGFLLLLLAFLLPIMQLIGTMGPFSPFGMLSAIGSKVGSYSPFALLDFIKSGQFPLFYTSLLLLPFAIAACLAGLLINDNDLRLLSAILASIYPISFFQIIPASMIFSIPIIAASLGVYCAIFGFLILFYKGMRESISPRFWGVVLLLLACMVFLYYNPGIIPQPVTQESIGSFSVCPYENNTMIFISAAANSSGVRSTGRLSLPYGDAAPYLIPNVSEPSNYRFGYASSCTDGQCACSFPSADAVAGGNEQYALQCRKGQLEGENVNYLYCYGFMSNIPGYIIAKESINPDGTIGKKYRYAITELILDSRDSSVKSMVCREIGCYGE